MKRVLTLFAAATFLVSGTRPAYAWDDFGHRLVARIAWDHMTLQARAHAIQILQGAAIDTRLRPFSATLSEQQQIDAFLAAATWPDDVRPPDSRSTKYHIRDRHFTDLFWRQNFDFGPVLSSTHPEADELLHDIPQLEAELAGPDREKAAVALAWLIHLVGDIHQPLHASGRITPVDPNGDAGGTLFCIRQPTSNGCEGRHLHSIWDGSVTGRFPKLAGETDDHFLGRVSRLIVLRHPRTQFAGEIGQTTFREWAQASVRIAQDSAYRKPLVRNHPPSDGYRADAFRAARPRIALAGYRLADLLNQALK